MRNYFFYILLICVFTNSFGKNEDKKKSSWKEPDKQIRGFYEQEAKTDIEKLLSGIMNNNFSEEDRKPFNVNERSSKLMERMDKSLKKSKNNKKHKNNLRTNGQINTGKFRRGVYLQNLPLNLWNAIESINLRNSDAPLMNKVAFPNGTTVVKSRISGGHNVITVLRNSVNYVNIKPEVYPLLYITDDKYGSREITSEKGIVQINNQHYTNENDKLTKLVNNIDRKHNNETFVRTATIPMSENFDLEGLLNKLHTKQELVPTRNESDTNVMLHDFLNKFYARSTNHLRPENSVEKVNNHLHTLDNIGSKHKDNSKTILLRSDVVDNVNSNTNERLPELMKYMDTAKILRTPHNALSYDQRPARRGDHRSRHRRSSGTQAGYTQDPDTCKTYNENLGKLWSNLSKLINIKDQPNDRALHNIAMMIQAYLEHQNAKQPPVTHIAKHEGPKDKISVIILRIRKLLDKAEGSPEKITKIILKYLRPDYRDVESEDCQQINKEYLTLSVDLLYKNYLEKNDCQGEDDGTTRNKKVSLRQINHKPRKTNISHMTLSMESSDPHLQNLLTENESYEDFYDGKMERLRPPKNRGFKPSRQQKSRPADKSGNQNEREKLNTRSKSSSKSTSKKHKKSSLKTDVEKNTCEKYAIRKLVVSLRPVMERFNGLLECQLDNTLRSVSFSRDSEDPYHRYASKFYSIENSRRDKKVSPRLPVTNTGRKINESHKKVYTERHGSSFENDQDARARDHDDETDSAWVQKYSFDKTESANSKAQKKKNRIEEEEDTDARVLDSDNNKHQSNNYYDNEYFQSPPSYHDYDGVYKTHQNAFPSLINPSISLNEKKITPSMSRSKQVSEETHDEFFKQETETITKNTPFIDLKLRSEHQLIEENNKIHVKSFENITEFLKRALDESLKTPEFAVPLALDTNKGYVEETETTTKNTQFIDLTKLRSEDQISEEKNKIHVKTIESITEFLKRARDESLKTTEFAVPFSLETNKGYVEETETTTKYTPFIDLTKLGSRDQLIEEKNNIHVKTFESLTEFLKRARDASLKTPEFAVPFALGTNKGYVEETETTTKNTPLIDLTKLRSEDQLIKEKNKIHVKTFESITEFLKRARDESLKTPEFAVPFALDTNKGYVELTHLLKYPKTLVYRPQYLVKNTMPYDDFLKTINNSNMINDDVRLMKIVRYLPNGSVLVLFETVDFEAPLEIRNPNDKDTRSSVSSDPAVDYQSERRIETASENNNTDLTDGNRSFSLNYRNEARIRRYDFQSAVKSDSSSSNGYLPPDLDLNTDTDTLRGNEELSQNSHLDDNSDTNSTSNSTSNSLESHPSSFSPLPISFANHPSPDFGKEMGSSVASQIVAGLQQGLGSQIDADMQMDLDTASNLDLKLNPMHPSQLGSVFSKLIPSHSNAQATPNPSLNSQSHMNSHFESPSGSYSASNSYSYLNSHSGSWSNSSHSLLPNTDSNNQKVGKNISLSTQSIAQWWRKWKSVIKGKLSKFSGRWLILQKTSTA